MRGFRVVRHETKELVFDTPGDYTLGPDKAVLGASHGREAQEQARQEQEEEQQQQQQQEELQVAGGPSLQHPSQR